MDTTTDLLEQATALLVRAVSAASADVPDAAILTRLAAAEEGGRLMDALRVQLAAEVADRSRPNTAATTSRPAMGNAPGRRLWQW